jgi:hypothetical protein
VVRTFSRADWSEASESWREGGFAADTWYRVRYAAACRGMLYPPAGGKGDDCDDPHPSQRAIVYRAIRDSPALLFGIIGRSSTWSQVVVALIHAVDAARADADIAEIARDRQEETRRRNERTAAPQRIGEIMRRAAGS